MNENEEVHEADEDRPEPLVTPTTYALRSPGRDLLLDFFSNLARFSLVFAQVVSVLSCIAILVFGIFQLCVGIEEGHEILILSALVGTPVAFLYQFAMLVVFSRATKAKSG